MSCSYRYKGFALPGDPKGTMVGQDYFTAAPNDAKQQSKAIILLTDIFGLLLPNPRIIADQIAEEVGVDVWVPDFFNGKPIADANTLEPLLPDRAGVKISWLGQIKFIINIVPCMPRLFANRPSVVDPRVHEFIKKIKSEKGYEKIGAVGYCLGGAIAGRLGSTDLVNTIVIAHPVNLSLDQIRAIKVPTSWALAKEDYGLKDQEFKTVKGIFREQEDESDHVDYEFRVYKGTAHGFALRPNLEVPDVKAGYEGALNQTISWFKKTL